MNGVGWDLEGGRSEPVRGWGGWGGWGERDKEMGREGKEPLERHKPGSKGFETLNEPPPNPRPKKTPSEKKIPPPMK